MLGRALLPLAMRGGVLVVVGFVVVACGGGARPAPKEAPSDYECPTTGSRECKESSDCGPHIHCTGGRCFADHVGCPCTETTDCGSGAHCTKGSCHANARGAACARTEECGAGAHCAGEICYANESGAPCSAPNDCGAGSSCVSGACN